MNWLSATARPSAMATGVRSNGTPVQRGAGMVAAVADREDAGVAAAVGGVDRDRAGGLQADVVRLQAQAGGLRDGRRDRWRR